MDIGLYNIHSQSDEIRYAKMTLKELKGNKRWLSVWCQAGDALFTGNIKIERSKKTGKIRHIYDGKTLIVRIWELPTAFNPFKKKVQKDSMQPHNILKTEL